MKSSPENQERKVQNDGNKSQPYVREFGRGDISNEGRSSAWLWFEQLGHDLRYSLRMLRHSPGFTSVAVLSLALGIGANTAVFSVLDALILRSLPVRSPDQLVQIKKDEDTLRSSNWLYEPWLTSYRELTDVFSDVSAIRDIDRFNLILNGPGGGSDGAKVRMTVVSGNYFPSMGVGAVVGRTLTPDDDTSPGGNPVAVISYDYWQRRFAGASDVVDRTFTLYNTTYTILGVAAQGFYGDWVGQRTDVWTPVSMYGQVMNDPRGLGLATVRIIARMKPGVTRPQAQSAVQAVNSHIIEESGLTQAQIRRDGLDVPIKLEPGAQGYSPQRKSFAQPVVIIMIVVGLVLMIACVNVANLLLARSSARGREMAVRRALGAGRMRIIRQLLTESILLAILAGALGLMFAVWGKALIVRLLAAGPVVGAAADLTSIDLDLNTDTRLLVFTAAVCVLTGILFGLAPAFRGSNVSLTPGLTRRGGSDSRASGGPARWLVVPQVALLLVLLVGTGLFVRTLHNLRALDLGFDREHVLQVWTAPYQVGRVGPALAPVFQQAQERIAGLPGVVSVSVSTRGLLNGLEGNYGTSDALRVEGQPPRPGQKLARAMIAPGYFETVGMKILDGREFTDRDTDTAPLVAVINETMAQFYFGDEYPIGKRFGFSHDVGFPRTIVGVVKDAKYDTPREKTPMMFYFPYRQATNQLSDMCVAVRTTGNPNSMAATVRQEIQDIDRSLPILRVNSIDDQLTDTLVQERMVTGLAVFLGVLAVLLASLGLYGVISYTVARRTNEIGIRMALGATDGNILLMVLKETLVLVLIGVAVGIPLVIATTRVVSAMLFGISAVDPLTIAAASVLMIIVATLAGLLPSRRASRVDPMIALRYE